MNTFEGIHKSRLLRHSTYNIIGHLLPMVIAFFAMPGIIRGYGLEVFGLLSLAWVFLGYFAFLDFGLNRATIKSITEKLGESAEQDIPSIIWSSLGLNMTFGIVTCVLLYFSAGFIVHRVLSTPIALQAEAVTMLRVLAYSIPIITFGTVTRGVLEAFGQFGTVNAIKGPSNSLIFFLPLMGVWLQLSIVNVIVLIVISRFLMTSLYFYFMHRYNTIQLLKNSFIHTRHLRSLLSYGGWITVSNVINPILTYLERFFIPSMLSIGVLAYYTAPYEMISRLSVLPASIAVALFPLFGYYRGRNAREESYRLVIKSSKFIFLALVPVVLCVISFSFPILELWLDAEFAHNAAATVRVLSLAFLFNALAYIPLAATQGFGFPEFKAKLDILELILFVPFLWILIPQYGILGAAIAKLIIHIVDCSFLLWFVRKIFATRSIFISLASLLRIVLPLLFISFSFYLINFLSLQIVWVFLMILGILLVYTFFVWRITLTPNDKSALLSELSLLTSKSI
jgi:O-antigen/teichoic acid export membrane protein